MLRPFDLADAPAVRRLAGAREVADTTLNVPHPYAEGLAEAWIRSHPEGFAAGREMVVAVTDRATGELLGAAGLRLDPQHALAELGYWIGVPFWGRGYATEAARCLVEHGFGPLRLNRVQACHLVRNPASGRVLQKVGMTYEGRRRQALRKWERFEDVETYAILAEDRRPSS